MQDIFFFEISNYFSNLDFLKYVSTVSKTNPYNINEIVSFDATHIDFFYTILHSMQLNLENF